MVMDLIFQISRKNLVNKLLFKILIFLSTVQFASGQTEQSLLWEISGPGLDEPSYLYGTIHIQDKRVFSFDSIVWKKFNECEAYAMELLLDEIDKEEIQKMMLMKDTTLRDLLSPEDYKLLDQFFRKKTGTGIMLYDKMKPFMVYSQISISGFSQDMPLALDAYFLEKARKSGKKALGIEKLSDQLGAIDQITLKDQAQMLMVFVKDTSSLEDNGFEEMLKSYCNADLKMLTEMTADTSLPGNFEEAFLTKRNETMAKNIVKFSKKQRTFSAIGAAHLGGEKGVIELIRKKGYMVKAIPFSFVSN